MADFPPDVAAAIDAGLLWRAKEIVAGRISSGGRYDDALYEQYGAILQLMHDDVLAGKYLFLSGVRRAEYYAPIRLYLERYARAGWQGLVGNFPNAAKRMHADEFPEAVASELKRLDMPPTNKARKAAQAAQKVQGRGLLGAAGCVLLGLLLAAAAEGFHYLIHWIFNR